jgi:hypothetical protein
MWKYDMDFLKGKGVKTPVLCPGMGTIDNSL